MVIFHSYVKLPEGTIYIYIRYYITHGYRSHSNSMACVCEPKWHCGVCFQSHWRMWVCLGIILPSGDGTVQPVNLWGLFTFMGEKWNQTWNLLEHQSKYVKTPKDPYQVGGFHWCPRTDTNLAPSCRSSSSGSSAWRSVFCQKPLGSSTSTTALVRVELLFVELKGGC